MILPEDKISQKDIIFVKRNLTKTILQTKSIALSSKFKEQEILRKK